MVVTRISLVLLLAMVGCSGVDNSVSTPGAYNCSPTDTQVTNFSNAPWAELQQCLRCHGNATAEANNTRTRFKLTNSPIDMRMNFCISYGFGQRSLSRALITHPQDSRHAGGQYSETDLEQLTNWVNTVRLD